MDFINSYNESYDISEAIIEVRLLSEKASHDVQSMAIKNSEHSDEHIRKVLNYYESMAICICHKIYDDDIIKDAVYTTVTDIWNICWPYVEERRKQKGSNTYFQELELLCKKWKKEPLKEK